jgi:hypothetical protein
MGPDRLPLGRGAKIVRYMKRGGRRRRTTIFAGQAGAMAKAELKTKETKASVEAFLKKQPEEVEADRRTIIKLMTKATGEEPKM